METIQPTDEDILQSILENLRLGAPVAVLPASSTLQFAQDQTKRDLAELEGILKLCRGQKVVKL